MKATDRRIFETIGRVAVFGRSYPQYFIQTSLAGQAMSEIVAAGEKFAEYEPWLRGGDVAVRTLSEDRSKARAELRRYLETISQIAKALRIREFTLPRDRSDKTLVSVGRMWARHAEPLKQVFIDSGLTDFIERLNSLVENVSRSIDDQTSNNGSRAAAIATIQQARAEALDALKRLDPMMTYILRDDPVTLAVWERARRAERGARGKSVGQESSPAVMITSSPVTMLPAPAPEASLLVPEASLLAPEASELVTTEVAQV
jgi:hypothetical protein